MKPLAFLNFIPNEELIQFFHCKKTEMSCMEQPNTFLNQLRDHDLVPEKLYKKVIRMRYKEKKKDGVYEVLDRLEKERSDKVKVFWRCVFHGHILQKYPVLCGLRKSLMDGSYKFYAKLLDSEELKDSPQSEENTAKKQRRRNKRKKSVEETEDDEQPSPSSSSSPNQQKSPKKPKFSSSEEMEESVEQREEREEEDEEEGEAVDLSEFQAPSLPVSCGSVSGVLFKSRFASGTRGKSIRTEERWFTPEEFVKQELTLTDGCWKRDIKCHSKTLSDLLQKILKVHSLLCKCDLCSPTEQELLDQDNDDECFICNSHGDLLCCDECPRAFHCHCHIPALHNNTLGDKWMCTYCVLKNNQHWLRHGTMTEEQALDCPVSQYILHCEYLLLCMYKEDTQRVFSKDPSTVVRRYRDFISEPMWLDRVKDKLHSQKYETLRHFVSDISLIFQNCTTVNRDNHLIIMMRSTLSQMFEREFKTIFNIQ